MQTYKDIHKPFKEKQNRGKNIIIKKKKNPERVSKFIFISLDGRMALIKNQYIPWQLVNSHLS